jgi:hypothetical protein
MVFQYLVLALVKIWFFCFDNFKFDEFIFNVKHWHFMMVIVRNVYRLILFRFESILFIYFEKKFKGNKRHDIFLAGWSYTSKIMNLNVIFFSILLGSTWLFWCTYIWITFKTWWICSYKLDWTWRKCYCIDISTLIVWSSFD